MTAAQIAFAFLSRGLNAGFGLSQFAALTYLAAHGESDRLTIMRAINRTEGSNNCNTILGPLVEKGFITQQLLDVPGNGRGKFVHDITPAGLRALGLKAATPPVDRNG